MLVVSIPILFQILILLSLVRIGRIYDRDRALEHQSKEAIASSYRLLGLLVDVETGMRGYALTGNPALLEPYDRALIQFPTELEHLKASVASTPERGDDRPVAELQGLSDAVLTYERSAVEQLRAGHRDVVIANSTREVGKKLMDRFRKAMDRFLAKERLVDADREKSVIRARNRITIALGIGGALNVALAALLTIFFTRGITRRVRVVVSNMARLERNEPLADRLAGRDEVAELDERFHDMARALGEADEQWKRAEENLRRFFTISLEMLCIAGFDGVFKLLNPAWEKVLGYRLHALYSRPFIDFVHPDDREATMAEAQRLAQGSSTVRFENRYRHADGSYRWLLWNAASLPEAQIIYAAATDITERKQFESTLQDRNVALETANRELESFSYSVSHDLRSPLRAVDGYARILEEEYAATLDDEGRRVLSVIRSEARRMGVLIDDLLAFSRIGRQSLSRTAVNLGDIAEEVIAEKRRNFPHRQIDFVRTDSPLARADPGAIRQVVFNLIANAVKYSKPDEAVHIEFGGRSNGEHNLYWVRDRGVGFDMRYAEKIFGVFQRLHSAHDIEGSGVGLAIVQRIIERHGGRVWAESEPGKGATFFFTLPVAEGKTNDEEAVNE